MKLRLQDFDTFPAQVCLETGSDSFEIDYDGVFGIRRVVVDLDIQKSDDEYFCQAGISAVVTLECSRCLGQYETELSTSTDFIVSSKVTYEELRKEAEDDENYVFYQGEAQVVDLYEIVRQTIILAVPMMPICSDNCRGLCPICGTNLNLHECNCHYEQINERWNGLKDLKNSLTKKR